MIKIEDSQQSFNIFKTEIDYRINDIHSLDEMVRFLLNNARQSNTESVGVNNQFFIDKLKDAKSKIHEASKILKLTLPIANSYIYFSTLNGNEINPPLLIIKTEEVLQDINRYKKVVKNLVSNIKPISQAISRLNHSNVIKQEEKKRKRVDSEEEEFDIDFDRLSISANSEDSEEEEIIKIFKKVKIENDSSEVEINKIKDSIKLEGDNSESHYSHKEDKGNYNKWKKNFDDYDLSNEKIIDVDVLDFREQ